MIWNELRDRNESLFYFGLVCFLLSVVFIVLGRYSTVKVNNVSAWYKPFKFAISIALYSWTMAWYCHYLSGFNVTAFNWVAIILLGFEIAYIALQAGRGQLSHFNLSTPVYSALYMAMAFAATAVTVYTAYVGVLFFGSDFPELPDYYLAAIRVAIFIFVIFSLQGFVMGSRLSHTIGGSDGGPGLPVLNWSTKFGDPRIAHFIGMHALQVIPFVAWYFVRNTRGVYAVSFLYLALAIFTLFQALNGKPLFRKTTSDQSVR